MRHAFASAALVATLASSTLLAQSHPSFERGFDPAKLYDYSNLDSVGLLNRNLIITIPIGQSFPLDGGRSYGLTLVHNSKSWHYKKIGTCIHPQPYRFSSAGMGWMLSLGKLVAPTDPDNDSGGWKYLAPDWSEHRFYGNLHPPDPPVACSDTTTPCFSRDSSYIRMRRISSTVRVVEFPDGTVHTFTFSTWPGGVQEWRITGIDDRFADRPTGHSDVDITYPLATSMNITDKFGRTQIVVFRSDPTGWVDRLVDYVQLTAFGSTLATYQFTYDTPTIETPRPVGLCDFYLQVQVPALTAVTLTDGSLSWGMTIGTTNPGTGAVVSLRLPTGGEIRYDYGIVELPTVQCPANPFESSSPGVSERTLFDRDGSQLGTWSYTSSLWGYWGLYSCPGHPELDPELPLEELQVTVVSPLKDKTIHYFSVFPGWRYTTYTGQSVPEDYGLPFSKYALSDGAAPPRFLSSEQLDCDANGNNCTPRRRTYVRWERDIDPAVPNPCQAIMSGSGLFVPSCYATLNRRAASSRTFYLDDPPGCVVPTPGNPSPPNICRYSSDDLSDFDQVGNYRVETTGGNFGAGDSRQLATNYNPGGYSLTGPQWILNTFDYQTQSEGSVTAKQEFCFEASTGYLLRSRTLKTGTAAGANDLLSIFTHDTAGNTIREERYGGEAQPISTAALCSLTPPTCGAYRIDHTSQNGARNTSRYFDTTTCPGTAMSFYSLDCDVDAPTGLYSACRDTAGLRTDFLYDTLGRPTWSKPESGQGAWLHHQYLKNGTCNGPPKVETCAKPNGTTTECVNASQSCTPYGDSLTRSAVHFDGLGRIVGEFTKYDGSNWNQRLTTYDGAGHTASVSEWQPSGTTGSSIKATVYSGLDVFGRPTTITPPDGTSHNVTMAYTGARLVSHTANVATAVGSETPATTTEEYDRLGRLWKVTEPSGAAGAYVTTTYGYDVGNRLKQVTATSGSTQNRYFTYDNRGFLTSEQLPELGSGGNGTVSYPYYDARGRVLRRYDGQNYLKLQYDRAERLFRVRKSDATWADSDILRQFDYATANNGTDKRNGKLLTATAYNVISSTTFPVAETYTYAGVGGRVSRRQTTVDGRTINLNLTWTQLGKLDTLTYPDDQDALLSEPSRALSHTYTMGFLSAIPSYASSITYHPNLMVKSVAGANGVTWTQQIADGLGGRPLDAMARPYSIAISGASSSWSLGPYQYDGAGDIKQIGNTAPYETFVYDKVQRLTSGTIVTGTPAVNRTQTASFNAFGFITNLTTNGFSQNFAVDANGATNHVSGMCYNGAGSVTAWGGTCGTPPYPYNYTWDPLNQMASTFGGSFTTRTFLYTADGERIEERVGSNPLSPTSITLSARGLGGKILRLYTKSGGSWSWTKDYIYRNAIQFASVEPPIATPVTKYYHLDHLRTVRRITSTANPAAIIASHDYYPFGTEATDPCQDAEELKWTGQERDQQGTCASQTDDLDYLHARFENFNIGRFLSLDPLSGRAAAPQSWNKYAYALGNPIKYVDPTGMQSYPDPHDPGHHTCDSPEHNGEQCEGEHEKSLLRQGFTLGLDFLVGVGQGYGASFGLPGSEPSPNDSPAQLAGEATGSAFALFQGLVMFGEGASAVGGGLVLVPVTGPGGLVVSGAGGVAAVAGGVVALGAATNLNATVKMAMSNGGSGSRTSVNQMDRQVQKGQAPSSVERVDRGRTAGEQPHVHFKDGSALNIDGSWKHGSRELSSAEKTWLADNGWSVP